MELLAGTSARYNTANAHLQLTLQPPVPAQLPRANSIYLDSCFQPNWQRAALLSVHMFPPCPSLAWPVSTTTPTHSVPNLHAAGCPHYCQDFPHSCLHHQHGERSKVKPVLGSLHAIQSMSNHNQHVSLRVCCNYATTPLWEAENAISKSPKIYLRLVPISAVALGMSLLLCTRACSPAGTGSCCS